MNMLIRNFLQSKRGTTLELFLFFGIAMSTFQLGIIIPIFVLLVIASLKIRKVKYSSIGLIKSDFTIRNILWGISIAFLYYIIFTYLLDPFLSKIKVDNTQKIFDIKGDIQKLVIWIIASWTIAAVVEEVIFRGYLINRLIELTGESLPAKSLIVILVGITFGFVHYYQGIYGVMAAGIFGVFQSVIYFINGKKLVIPIVAHGAFDTIGFIVLFLR